MNLEIKSVPETHFTDADGKKIVRSDTEAVIQHFETRKQSLYNCLAHWQQESLKAEIELMSVRKSLAFLNGDVEKPVESVDKSEQMTISALVAHLKKVEAEYGPDFIVDYCTEHKVVGGQLQEGIKDLAVSERTKRVILLAQSFK